MDNNISESGMKLENDEKVQCCDKHHKEECDYLLQLKICTCEYMSNKQFQEKGIEHNCNER